MFRPVTMAHYGQFVLYEDITERRRAEEEKENLQAQLQQAQKMEAVGTLAGGIAHDFNNILQAIDGYTQLMLMEKPKQDLEYNRLTSIQNSVSRASSLVKNLLLFSRKAETEFRPVELIKEVEHALNILKRAIPKMVEIEVHYSDRVWTIMADPVQIEQIILNLGNNAVDAMPDGGNLVFEVKNITLDDNFTDRHLGSTPGNYVLLSVSDTGQGMDKQTTEKIFEPFFTTKEFGKGTGLGLASVYGIVKKHDGYISCYSETGHGTTFRIFFPAIEQVIALDEKEDVQKPIPTGNETILIVDDEEEIREITQEALGRFGYAVITVSSGEEALELYSTKSNEIDLVIMDLWMPGMGGRKCLQELIQIDPKIKVIISSGHSINGQVKKVIDSGAKGYVGKPFQLADLLNTLRAVLDEDC